jgi:hypothetical protein
MDDDALPEDFRDDGSEESNRRTAKYWPPAPCWKVSTS